jgi:hypothetical protein
MARRKVRTHRFNGVKYHIDIYGDYGGSCDTPKRPKKYEPEISLVQGLQNTQESLSFFIHEMLHASNWKIHEDKVHVTAEDIASLLWRTGWRIRR